MSAPGAAAAATGRRRWRPLLLGLLCSLAFLLPLWLWIDWRVAVGVLGGLDLRRLLAPLLVTLVTLPLRPWRWQAIFPAAVRPPFTACFAVLAVGVMANNLIPGRGGDVLRAVLIAPPGAPARVSFALGTVAVEKLLDGLALFAALALAWPLLDPPAWLAGLFAAACGVFGVAVLALWLLRRRRLPAVAWLGERVGGVVEQFTGGLTAIDTPRRWLGLGALTAAVWAAEAVEVWLLAAALGVPLSLPAALVVTAVIGLGLMIPAGPSSIGTYEFFAVGGLMLFGVAPPQALALTLVLHAWSIVVTTATGLAGMAIGGVGLASLRRLR